MAHAIVVFPGGVGTAEEILYLLGILLSKSNSDIEVPVVFTGPQSSAAYFEQMHHFVGATLGPRAQALYSIVIGAPERVADRIVAGIERVRDNRDDYDQPYFFNWQLEIELDFQKPFYATHQEMFELELHRNQPVDQLAVNLRRAFSGIVGGNVRESGIRAVQQHGPYEIGGEENIIAALDELLRNFIAEGRMKLSDPLHYVPCYRIVA
jgi:hypothetical protein